MHAVVATLVMVLNFDTKNVIVKLGKIIFSYKKAHLSNL